jgi:hypothetical protein
MSNKSQQDAKEEELRRFADAVERYRIAVMDAVRSRPSTHAVSATLVASGSGSNIAEDQAHQVVDKNIIPIIDLTAKKVVQEERERIPRLIADGMDLHDERVEAKERRWPRRITKGILYLLGLLATFLVGYALSKWLP